MKIYVCLNSLDVEKAVYTEQQAVAWAIDAITDRLYEDEDFIDVYNEYADYFHKQITSMDEIEDDVIIDMCPDYDLWIVETELEDAELISDEIACTFEAAEPCKIYAKEDRTCKKTIYSI